MRYFEDPILGKGRAADVSGGTGSADYVGGTRIAIAGETISFVNSATIQNVTGNSVTLEPDTAYKITATASAVTLNANVPAAGQWAYEGHAEIFVAGTGYVVTGPNVYLTNALEPDSVNNCTLRFHDGRCFISVEDHAFGYIVTLSGGTYTTEEGTLTYGITGSTDTYIAFDASLNGQTIQLSGGTETSVANGEKHLVGNGYTETTLTGAVDCGSSKFTVANLSLQNVAVNGGTMTLGDAYIPSGSTVAVSGGGLAVEKVTGAGSESVVNLDSQSINVGGNSVANIGGVMFTGLNKTGGNGGAFYIGSEAILNASNCIISGNHLYGDNSDGFGVAAYTSSGTINLSGCTISGNTMGNAYACVYGLGGGSVLNIVNTTITGNTNGRSWPCAVQGSGTVNIVSSFIKNNVGVSATTAIYVTDAGEKVIQDSVIDGVLLRNASVSLRGSNSVLFIAPSNPGISGSVTLTSGAILDLTGNTNATPIAPGGGITFESGGATVKVGDATASLSYMMDNVTLPAVAKLTNTAVVNLGGGTIYQNGGIVNASGCTFTSASAAASALAACYRLLNCAEVRLSGCTFSGNAFTVGNGACVGLDSSTVYIDGCSFDEVSSQNVRCNAANITLSGSNFFGAAIFNPSGASPGAITIKSGAIVRFGNTDNCRLQPGGDITVESGCTFIDKNGNEFTVSSGTYTQIKADGTTVPPQE